MDVSPSLWLCVCRCFVVRAGLFASLSLSLSTSLCARRCVVNLSLSLSCPRMVWPIPVFHILVLAIQPRRLTMSLLSLSYLRFSARSRHVQYHTSSFRCPFPPSHAHIHSSQIIRTYTVHRALCPLLHSSFRALVGPGSSTCMSIVPSAFPLITTSLLCRVLYV